MSASEDLLQEAIEVVSVSRNQDYGPPKINLQRICNYWNEYLDQNSNVTGDYRITPKIVCDLMILLKMARAVEGYKRDTYVDLAGYASLVSEVSDDA